MWRVGGHAVRSADAVPDATASGRAVSDPQRENHHAGPDPVVAATDQTGVNFVFGDEAIVTLTPSPTPTPGLCASDCNNNSAVSINELVGKLDEWVADWGNRASTCANWDAAHGNDLTCVGGNGTGGIPDALFPGGDFRDGSDAGVFAAFSDGPSPHRHP